MPWLEEALAYHIANASANEAEGSMKVGMPGAGDVPLTTRASLLPDMELFEHRQHLVELGLPPAKLLSFAISEGFVRPHPMFASGTGSQVRQSRRRPRGEEEERRCYVCTRAVHV